MSHTCWFRLLWALCKEDDKEMSSVEVLQSFQCLKKVCLETVHTVKKEKRIEQKKVI